MLVKDLMTVSITTVSPLSPVSRVIEIMRSEDTGIVPVCDRQGHLLGLITDRDIVIRNGLCPEKTAEEIMTSDVIYVSPREDIHNATLLLSRHGIRRLPVVENERLVGILSLKDLAKKKIMTAEIGHVIYQVCRQTDM